MKIAWFKTNISPEIGCHLAGYSLNDISVAKLDDLFMTGLCMDDGERKVLLVSAEQEKDIPAGTADLSLFADGIPAEELLPLVLPLPCAYLAQALAEKEGRGMFLSDQPIRLF